MISASGVAEERDSRVSGTSLPEAKISLFQSLFHGRTDVYARRFESRRTGKAGYQPACGNEWVSGVCEKPRIKCSECRHQSWLGVNEQTLRWHLSGQDESGRPFVMGVYPMLRDETCFFLAADFDGQEWQRDALAFSETAVRLGVAVALERSRSGEGGHVWIFFEEAVPCAVARRLGAYILTEAMESRPEIGFPSYDRFFPNQDTLPRGGFGNLIALPLQKQARTAGNSVFVDRQFMPYEDQWEFLSSIRRLPRNEVESMVRSAEERGRVLGVRTVGMDDDAPWTTAPSRGKSHPPITEGLPEHLEIVLADQLYFSKEGLPPELRNRLVRLAAFQNPEFYRAQAMRLPVFNKSRIICCAEEFPKHIALPRGCLEEAIALLRSLKVKPSIRDERYNGKPLAASFRGTLREDQQRAADKMLAHETGVLAATTAFGKTVLAAWLIGQRGVNTLVLVHRQQLLEQWVERLASFLDLPQKAIGRIGGGSKKPGGLVDVAIIQSLFRKEEVDDRVADYGHLVVDECHHLSAHSFESVARRAKARFVTGLSATVTRKDGHHPIIFMQCGPVRYRVDAKRQAEQRPFSHRVFVRPTAFRSLTGPVDDPRVEFQNLVMALAVDPARNALICRDVIESVKEGRTPLVLTERTSHVEELAGRLAPEVPEVITLKGGMSRKALTTAMQRLGEMADRFPRVVIATGRFVGEGFDHARLDTLFLALPVSWRGTIAQYAGRLHRLHDLKKEARIYDYADLDVPMLERMFDKRCRGYEAVGYSILLPASAVAGWPCNVPLPIDPEWKRDYAASVRRLIHDGVDAQLANLFVFAARKFTQDAKGVDRARSASEAFLFQRLESLPLTRGLFQLNRPLPIPFDNLGSMEVDFLCESARLVIELDGPQHLADPEAYRRDRKKDEALQRNGYFILRFLTEDVGKNLNEILDTILSALAFRKR